MRVNPQPFPELRGLRRRAGLSQQRLAELAGVNRSTIARIESGQVPVDAYLRAKLAALLRTRGTIP